MSEEIRSKSDVLTLSLTISAECSVNDLVKISDDNTVTKAGSGEVVSGRVISLPESFPGLGSVETKFSSEIEVTASEEVAAGDFAKVGAASGDVQRYAKFVPGTDDPTLNVGQFLTGGIADATVSLLIY